MGSQNCKEEGENTLNGSKSQLDITDVTDFDGSTKSQLDATGIIDQTGFNEEDEEQSSAEKQHPKASFPQEQAPERVPVAKTPADDEQQDPEVGNIINSPKIYGDENSLAQEE